MLLFTMTTLVAKTAKIFQWSFHLMEGPNRNMNICFIVIGAIGAIYWLWRQNNYNKVADQQGSIK